CGQRVVVLDDTGDYTALGLAELLAGSGRTVEIVTAFPQAGIRLMPHLTADYAWIYPRLVESGVTITTQAFIEAIEPGSVTFENAELNALHAEAFEHRVLEDDWQGQVAGHSLGWVCARDDDGLVGFVNVAWDGGVHAFVLDTMVTGRAARRGVGTQLVVAAVA